ncbi:MAG: hypothetical protein ACK5XN_18660 [Bacteroidota bacterium]|jgi:hypothetical protein
MSDVVLLRKLTEKSTLKFGIYSDIPIYNLLDLKRYSYLRWVYYNSSNITFLDSILKEIGITEEYYIDKPGKNTELGIKLNDIKKSKMSFKAKKHYEKVDRCNKKDKKLSKTIVNNFKYSKGSLQARNHGK